MTIKDGRKATVLDEFLTLLGKKGYHFDRLLDTASFFNAEWDPYLQQAGFGDNAIMENEKPTLINGRLYYPNVIPDVVAHELGHGFSQQHANFAIDEGPSSPAAGIGESFADMMAKAFEYYLTGKTTWAIGSDLIAHAAGAEGFAIRYMDDPTKDCQFQKPCSIDQVKNFGEGIDGHFSSGILNKAFYLLVTSPGWNTRSAFEVMVQANRYHWTSKLDFMEAACGVWDAGNDLHAGASNMMSGITTAMAAVGLTANEEQCHPAG